MVLKNDAALQAEVKGYIINVLPVLSAMAGGTQLTFTEGQLQQMTACLYLLQARGSAVLQKDLGQLLHSIKNGVIFKALKRS